MSCPSRFELDDPMTVAPPIEARRAGVRREPIRLLKFLAYLAIGGSERSGAGVKLASGIASADAAAVLVLTRFAIGGADALSGKIVEFRSVAGTPM